MSARPVSLAALGALAFAPAVLAQQQVVRPPIAVYWVSAETSSGMNPAAGAAGMMGMMMGGGGGATRFLDLRLGSTQSAQGEPRAAHQIPPGLAMGSSLPLLSPVQAAAVRGERDLPEGVEQPKGRMLIYWGCGEKAGAGQPVVIDFARVAAGQRVPNLVNRRVAGQQGPGAGRSRSYGEWPNREDSKAVPPGASLLGSHTVRGNYSPEIRFAVDDRHDFLAPVALTSGRSDGGGAQLQWQRIPNATGYFMTAFGTKGEDETEIVMWSSSEVQEMGGALLDYVPPAEVTRLIREKVVLSPERTDCVMPAEVVSAMQMPMLRFVAYGEELNVVHPPRPADPKVPWEQQYAVKLRLKSTAMLPIGEGEAMGTGAQGGTRAGGAQAPAASGARRETPPAESPAGGTQSSTPAGAVEEGVRVLRGIFGR